MDSFVLLLFFAALLCSEIPLPIDGSSDHHRQLATGDKLTLTLDEISAEIHVTQARALQEFFEASRMAGSPSSQHHNWQFQEPLFNTPICNFTGITCDVFGFVVALELVDMSLSGTLSDSFDRLPRLRRLKLFNNSLYGEIPPSLLQSSVLDHFNVGHNFLTGPFPDVSNLPSLSRLIVDRNAFSGSLPTSLCSLQSLEALDLSSITKMHGTIPSCLGDIPKLNKLRVTDVGLTGTVPSSLCGADRDMNGFAPNTIGCDVIACQQGYFQKPAGRQTDGNSPCLVCDVPSNVIGSSTCQWHDRFEPIQPPTTTFPTLTPSSTPTAAPTVAPTSSPVTVSPSSSPSFQPTVRITEAPSLAPKASLAPTGGPSFNANTGVPVSLSVPSSAPSAMSPSLGTAGGPSTGTSTIVPTNRPSASSLKSAGENKEVRGTGGYVAGSVAFLGFIFVVALLAARRRRNPSKPIPLEDHELLPPALEKSNDNDAMTAEELTPPPGILVPTVDHNSSILRTALRQTPPSLIQSNRRVRFDVPEESLSSLDESAPFGIPHISDASSPLEKRDAAWTNWMNPFLDPIRLCQAPFQGPGDGVSLVSYDSSTHAEESKSNAESRESRDELESVLGIRDRYSINSRKEGPRSEHPTTEPHTNVADSTTEPDTTTTSFMIDDGYHDIGDTELAAEHAADSMMEV